MARGALWLLQIVGIGNVFTKEDIRKAFPGVTQADRRIRDLRSFSWRIATNANDASLSLGEQRFVEAGAKVWEPNSRLESTGAKPISSKVRSATFAADNFQCVRCGIAGGERYLEEPTQAAVITVVRTSVFVEESDREDFTTLCRRCRDGDPGRETDLSSVDRAFEDLTSDERRTLQRWLSRGRRARTSLDRAWIAIQHLPTETRRSTTADLIARGQ